VISPSARRTWPIRSWSPGVWRGRALASTAMPPWCPLGSSFVIGICPTPWAVCPDFRSLRSRPVGSWASPVLSVGESFGGAACAA